MSHIVSAQYKSINDFLKASTVTIGNRIVLEIVEDERRNKIGDIFIPQDVKANANYEMMKAKVVRISEECMMKYGIKKDDIVLYDRYSAYNHPPTEPGTTVIVDAENIICKIV